MADAYKVGDVVQTRFGRARVVEYYGLCDVSRAAPVDQSVGFGPVQKPSGRWLVPA